VFACRDATNCARFFLIVSVPRVLSFGYFVLFGWLENSNKNFNAANQDSCWRGNMPPDLSRARQVVVLLAVIVSFYLGRLIYGNRDVKCLWLSDSINDQAC
jgi:hypothetical protein